MLAADRADRAQRHAAWRENRWAIGADDADEPKPQPAHIPARRRLVIPEGAAQQPHIPETTRRTHHASEATRAI